MQKKVYLIIELSIHDHEMYAEYVKRASEIVTRFGGTYLARCSSVKSLAGDWQPERIVLLAFDSRHMLDECFNSEEYKEIAHLRQKSTSSKAVIVEEN
jgi:uncharacterized protein (DUF1330 family)